MRLYGFSGTLLPLQKIWGLCIGAGLWLPKVALTAAACSITLEGKTISLSEPLNSLGQIVVAWALIGAAYALQ